MSQSGLDPHDPKFDPSFRARVIAAARAAVLVVILSVQDESQSGETHVATLPNEGTRRVWASIAPEFAQDDDMMFELLNEPNHVFRLSPEGDGCRFSQDEVFTGPLSSPPNARLTAMNNDQEKMNSALKRTAEAAA